MKLTITAVASYSTEPTEGDIEAIKEDIEDCLRFTGSGSGSGIIVEAKVDQ